MGTALRQLGCAALLLLSGLCAHGAEPVTVDCARPPVVIAPIPDAVDLDCPECADAFGMVQQSVEGINRLAVEINQERAALHALLCDDDPRDAPPGGCAGKRLRLSLIYRGKAEGGFGPFESLVTHAATLIDQEDYSTADEMIKKIEETVGEPVDITGKCGNCLEILRLTAHGSDDDSLGMRFGPGLLAPGDVGPGGEMKDGANRQVLDLMLKLRGYMCTDGLLQIFQCNAATGEKGKELGQAVANYMGVGVVAPDFAVPMGYGCGLPDSIAETPVPVEGRENWHPFEPADPVESAEDLQQRQARAIQDRIDKLVRKRDRGLADLELDLAAYHDCVREHCPKLLPPEPTGGALTTGGGGTPVPPADEPPPPIPPQPEPPTPQWSVEHPCPHCKPLLDLVRQHQQAAAALEQDMAGLRGQLAPIHAEQQKVRNRIARLQTAIESIGASGDGGSARDPETGITTDAWTQPDGSVRITVRDGAGNVLEERVRDRKDSGKLREEMAAEEANLAALEASAADLGMRIGEASRARDAQLELAAAALAALRDCVRKYCVPSVGYTVEVEQVFHLQGNNPFDPRDPVAADAGDINRLPGVSPGVIPGGVDPGTGGNTNGGGSGSGGGGSAFQPTSGAYAGDSGCGIASTNLTAGGGGVTANPLNTTNGAQSFLVSGVNATSGNTNLFILGAFGHTCEILNGTPTAFRLHCFRTADPGIQCNENFSR